MNLKIRNITIYIIFVHTVVILLLVTLQKEKNIRTLEGKIREKEQELQQLQEFAKKLSTDFVRNVRPRLQRQFPDLYKGKDGNQKLFRDVRLLKIACNGNIPKEMANETENLKALIRQGKNKVCKDTGMPEETENFLLQERLQEEEQARLDRFDDSDTDDVLNESTVQISIDNHSLVKENTLYSHEKHTNIPTAFSANGSLQPPTTYLNVPVVPTTGFVHPPTYPTQPNPHFDMGNPWSMQPYHYPYNPQYQSTFANLISTCQPRSFLINTNSTPYLHSTFTSTALTPCLQSTFTSTASTPCIQPNSTCTTSTEEAAAQPTTNQDSSLIDLAEVALES